MFIAIHKVLLKIRQIPINAQRNGAVPILLLREPFRLMNLFTILAMLQLAKQHIMSDVVWSKTHQDKDPRCIPQKSCKTEHLSILIMKYSKRSLFFS